MDIEFRSDREVLGEIEKNQGYPLSESETYQILRGRGTAIKEVEQFNSYNLMVKDGFSDSEARGTIYDK